MKKNERMKKWNKYLTLMLMLIMAGFFSFRAGITEVKAADPKAWQKINGVCYNGSGQKIPGAITRGIDVSSWQGVINWKKVKNSDVDFAFIRIAHGVDQIDSRYEYNMTEAEAAGIPVGTYVYSLALTKSQAYEEARLAIKKMQGHKVSYPVVYDLEDKSISSKLSKSEVADLAVTFCNEIRAAGYYPMLYCNLDWYNNYVDWDKLSGIDVWVACYGDSIPAPSRTQYNYTIWQSTDGDGGGRLNPTKGLIDGIPIYNNCDIDFGFVDYTKKITPRTRCLSSYTLAKNGWYEENGKTFYYVNDQKVTGWKKIDGKYYYFNKTKGLYRCKLLISPKKNICYVDKNGARVTNRWVTWEKKRYYMASNGYALKGVHKINGKYYYFNTKNAYMYKNKKAVNSKGDIYYFGSDGARYCDGFFKIKENGKTNTYYFEKNGKACFGWKTIEGKRYYFYKKNSSKAGIMAKNTKIRNSRGKIYIFDSNGVCVNA